MGESRPPVGVGYKGEGRERVSRKVLLADDEPAVLGVTAKMLRLMGYEVVQVTSARGLLQALGKEGEYDLIIADNTMPVEGKPAMSGTEALREIRKNPRYKRHKYTPALIYSGDLADTGIKETVESEELGGIYLAKPFERPVFEMIVRGAIMDREGNMIEPVPERNPEDIKREAKESLVTLVALVRERGLIISEQDQSTIRSYIHKKIQTDKERIQAEQAVDHVVKLINDTGVISLRELLPLIKSIRAAL